MSIDEQKKKRILNGINKTGFPFEFKISKILENNNWNVINNRYYIDTNSNIEREIDIVAYKCTLLNDI